MKRLGYKNYGIDSVDAEILTAMAANARISMADLARTLGMSAPSVTERLKRLEENGVIKRFTIEIDPKVLGYPLSVYILIRPIAGELKRAKEKLNGIPEIVSCDRITGEDCFIARAFVRSVDHLERIIDKINPYAQTNTSLIQSSPVPWRLPELIS